MSQNSTALVSFLPRLDVGQHPDCSSQRQDTARPKPTVQETDSQGPNTSLQGLQGQHKQAQSRHGAEASSTGQTAASVDASGAAREQIEHNGIHAATQADLQRLEQEFVHDVYNAIAPHFSATRFAVWPKVCLIWIISLTWSITPFYHELAR